jgi:hypothetical protein
MTDKQMKGPDERFDTVSKGNTRQTAAAGEKNKQKPDDVRLKGEVTTHHHHEEEEVQEEE